MTLRNRVRPSFVVIAATAVLMLSSTSAFGAGDATLDHLIVRNPVPGWKPVPAALIQQVVSLEQRALSSITGEAVQVAAEGWQEGPNLLLVVIANLQNEVPSGDREARQAVISACTTASNNPPKSVGNYAAISSASEATCVGRTAAGRAITATTIAWVDTNLFTIIIGGGLSRPRVEGIADRQNAAIPANGLEQSPSATTTTSPSPSGSASARVAGLQAHSTGSNAALVVAIAGGGALVAFATLLLVTRSRRAPQPPPAMATAGGLATASSTGDPAVASGWHPIDGDPSRYAYWDGTRWTARRYWNGTEWIESDPGAS